MQNMRPQDVKPADSRDMIGAHDMFRAHFGALPDLIQGAPAADPQRAKVIAEHVALLTVLLHGHHGSEDVYVWPRLQERCPHEIRPLVDAMEFQHAQIDTALRELQTRAQAWARSADAADRDATAKAARDLNPTLREHLKLEEERVLRLIDTYLTDAEWKESVAASAAKLSPENGALAIGMLLDQADEPMREIIREGAPEEFWRQVRPAAMAAYDAYAERVYGSARP